MAETVGGLGQAVLFNEVLKGESCGHENYNGEVLHGPQLRQPFTYDEATQMMFRMHDLAAHHKEGYYFRLYKSLEDGFRTLAAQIELEWRASRSPSHELAARKDVTP